MISPALLKSIRADVDAALAPVIAKYGLQSLTCGSATYTSDSFSIKLNGLKAGGLDEYGQIYETNARFDKGLPPLGTRFLSGREEYQVTGMKRSGNVIAKRTRDGLTFRFPLDGFKRLVAHLVTTAA